MTKKRPILVRKETIRKAVKLAQASGEICIVLNRSTDHFEFLAIDALSYDENLSKPWLLTVYADGSCENRNRDVIFN